MHNFGVNLGATMKLAGIFTHTMINQTSYGTHLTVTLFDLWEVIRGHHVILINEKSHYDNFWLKL